MTTPDGPSPAQPVADGKAGRNESRKLLGTFLNNLGLAFFVGAVIQPILAIANRSLEINPVNVAVTVTFSALGLICLGVAHRVVRRLED